MLLTPNNASIFQDHMSNKGREEVSGCESEFMFQLQQMLSIVYAVL